MVFCYSSWNRLRQSPSLTSLSTASLPLHSGSDTCCECLSPVRGPSPPCLGSDSFLWTTPACPPFQCRRLPCADPPNGFRTELFGKEKEKQGEEKEEEKETFFLTTTTEVLDNNSCLILYISHFHEYYLI